MAGEVLLDAVPAIIGPDGSCRSPDVLKNTASGAGGHGHRPLPPTQRNLA
jgi:hypothetical protein